MRGAGITERLAGTSAEVKENYWNRHKHKNVIMTFVGRAKTERRDMVCGLHTQDMVTKKAFKEAKPMSSNTKKRDDAASIIIISLSEE